MRQEQATIEPVTLGHSNGLIEHPQGQPLHILTLVIDPYFQKFPPQQNIGRSDSHSKIDPFLIREALILNANFICNIGVRVIFRKVMRKSNYLHYLHMVSPNVLSWQHWKQVTAEEVVACHPNEQVHNLDPSAQYN